MPQGHKDLNPLIHCSDTSKVSKLQVWVFVAKFPTTTATSNQLTPSKFHLFGEEVVSVFLMLFFTFSVMVLRGANPAGG